MGELDDGELLVLVGQQDPAALAELYDRHAGWLMLRLLRRCADRGLVEEVLQDTFVSVWRSARSFATGSVGAWLWTLASRRLVDGLRSAGRPVGRSPGHRCPRSATCWCPVRRRSW